MLDGRTDDLERAVAKVIAFYIPTKFSNSVKWRQANPRLARYLLWRWLCYEIRTCDLSHNSAPVCLQSQIDGFLDLNSTQMSTVATGAGPPSNAVPKPEQLDAFGFSEVQLLIGFPPSSMKLKRSQKMLRYNKPSAQ
jgi:hypothetical protein